MPSRVESVLTLMLLLEKSGATGTQAADVLYGAGIASVDIGRALEAHRLLVAVERAEQAAQVN